MLHHSSASHWLAVCFAAPADDVYWQGTLSHMSPELLLHGHASRASDVYAFGVMLVSPLGSFQHPACSTQLLEACLKHHALLVTHYRAQQLPHPGGNLLLACVLVGEVNQGSSD